MLRDKENEEMVRFRTDLLEQRLKSPIIDTNGVPIFQSREVAPISFSEVIKKRMTVEKEKPQDFRKLLPNIEAIKDHCKNESTDWVTIVSGMEGAGKSTLALQLAKLFDPQFSFSDQMIYSWNEEYGYLDFIRKFRNIPFRSSVFDEAITLLFSREHSSGDTKDAVKTFNMNRDLKHFSFLVVPSPWSLDIDLRERRARSLFYVFQNVKTHKRYYAYYSAKKMVQISSDESLRRVWRYPKLFMARIHPNFIEAFPKLEGKFEDKYLIYKRNYFDDMISSMEAKYKIRNKK